MASDPTPEERAASNFNRVFEGRGPMYVARLADLIREAQEDARKKAFEEAEAFLAEEVSRQEKVLAEANALMKKVSPDAARALSESPPPSSYQRVKNVLDRLREKIRARAKEAPRG